MRICVFCGSSDGTKSAYREAARTVARELAARGIGIVYGGGRVGCMGALADAGLAAGGEVIGVIPRALEEREIAHRELSALHIVQTMHERKSVMADLSGAFLALPGGFGTLEELFETITWRQLGIHDKPSAVLNVDGYYDTLVAFCDLAAKDGFIRSSDRDAVLSGVEIAPLLDALLERVKAGRSN